MTFFYLFFFFWGFRESPKRPNSQSSLDRSRRDEGHRTNPSSFSSTLTASSAEAESAKATSASFSGGRCIGGDEMGGAWVVKLLRGSRKAAEKHVFCCFDGDLRKA